MNVFTLAIIGNELSVQDQKFYPHVGEYQWMNRPVNITRASTTIVSVPQHTSRTRNQSSVLIHAPLRPSARRHRSRWLIASIFQQQCYHSMSRDLRDCHIPDHGPIIGMRPKILEKMVWNQHPCSEKKPLENDRTRTEYWRPARIHGDSVKEKNISAGWSSTFSCHEHKFKPSTSTTQKAKNDITSMTTVPFSLSPLQYCAGCVTLLVQSGCQKC